MKSAIAGMAALALVSSRASATEATSLAPGKPAGVQQAQRHHPFPLLLTLGIAAVVVAGVVVAVENSNNGSCGSACSTTGTSSP